MRVITWGFALLAVVVQVGCTTTSVSNTSRTSTEQLLIANAVDQALDKVDFAPFNGQTVFLEDKYVDCIDNKYVISSVRHRILRAGGALVDSRDKARVYVELRNGAVGTELSESFVGIPELVLPGVLTLPEIKVANRTSQQGVAKIGLVAIDTETMQILGDGGISTAQSDNSNYYVMGVGPIQMGSLKSELSSSLSNAVPAEVTPVPTEVAFAAPPFRADDVQLTGSEGDSNQVKVLIENPSAPAADVGDQNSAPAPFELPASRISLERAFDSDCTPPLVPAARDACK